MTRAATARPFEPGACARCLAYKGVGDPCPRCGCATDDQVAIANAAAARAAAGGR